VRDAGSADLAASLGLSRPRVAGDLATLLSASDLPAPGAAADLAIVARPWNDAGTEAQVAGREGVDVLHDAVPMTRATQQRQQHVELSSRHTCPN